MADTSLAYERCLLHMCLTFRWFNIPWKTIKHIHISLCHNFRTMKYKSNKCTYFAEVGKIIFVGEWWENEGSFDLTAFC